MPAYNAEPYWPRAPPPAPESIPQGQDLRGFEFLIVDDGSTDRSRAS